MYLISQLWWYLTLAFLLGALTGYLLWRLCNLPLVESRFERSRREISSRLAVLEDEKAQLAKEDHSGEGAMAKLNADLAALKARLEASEAASRAAAENHAEALKVARAEAYAEAARQQSEDIKQAKSEVASALAAAADAKNLHNTVIAHEAKVREAQSAAMSAQRQLDDAKTRHQAEMKSVAEAQQRHSAEMAKLKTDHEAVLARWKADLAAATTAATTSAAPAAGERPLDILKAPRGGKADDLKLIWGVGPKLEKLLNTAGFFHFDQIAKWTDKELTWVDSQLGEFAGRAERDKWVEQCQKLAGGWRPQNGAGDKLT